MRFRQELVAACAALTLTACSAAAAGSPDSAGNDSVPATVPGVGVLPAEPASDGGTSLAIGAAREATAAPATAASDGSSAEIPSPETASDSAARDDAVTTTRRPPSSATTTTVAPPVPVGQLVTGNRILMIGDSILASTSRRYSNTMCRTLVPLGWQVAIEAEVSREISFGNRVLRSQLGAGWDAALILLGNNYGQKPNVFMAELDEMLAALQPRPVLLLTVTEFEPVQQEVNEIIRSVAPLYQNVTVVDWAAMSNFPGVLSGDGLHLTDDGREFLAQVVAPYLGQSPVATGDCLSSRFHDDSAGSVNGPSSQRTGGPKPTSTTLRPTPNTSRPTSNTSKPTATTARPTATTTKPTAPTRPSSPPQTSPPQTRTPQTSPAQTSPPQTSAPQTSPPQTSPPQTGPPQTSPPQTSPPQSSPPQTSPPQSPSQTSPP